MEFMDMVRKVKAAQRKTTNAGQIAFPLALLLPYKVKQLHAGTHFSSNLIQHGILTLGCFLTNSISYLCKGWVIPISANLIWKIEPSNHWF
jgi:hypothetical protein